MNINAFVGIGVVAASLAAPAPAAAACCGDSPSRCCESMARCCDSPGDALAASVIVPRIDRQVILPPIDAIRQARAPRETMTVWFMRPVKIGDRILFGKYIVEHDNVRMAKGHPCTHIYAADDPREPVVRFHCEHLKQPPVATSSVTLRSMGEANGMREFVAFQFAGEDGAHGVPTR